jgi:hypothetical protein
MRVLHAARQRAIRTWTTTTRVARAIKMSIEQWCELCKYCELCATSEATIVRERTVRTLQGVNYPLKEAFERTVRMLPWTPIAGWVIQVKRTERTIQTIYEETNTRVVAMPHTTSEVYVRKNNVDATVNSQHGLNTRKNQKNSRDNTKCATGNCEQPTQFVQSGLSEPTRTSGGSHYGDNASTMNSVPCGYCNNIDKCIRLEEQHRLSEAKCIGGTLMGTHDTKQVEEWQWQNPWPWPIQHVEVVSIGYLQVQSKVKQVPKITTQCHW